MTGRIVYKHPKCIIQKLNYALENCLLIEYRGNLKDSFLFIINDMMNKFLY